MGWSVVWLVGSVYLILFANGNRLKETNFLCSLVGRARAVECIPRVAECMSASQSLRVSIQLAVCRSDEIAPNADCLWPLKDHDVDRLVGQKQH